MIFPADAGIPKEITMNKMIFKTCAAGVIAMGLVLLPLSAKDAGRFPDRKDAGRKDGPRAEHNMPSMPAFNGGFFHSGMMMHGVNLMGTVSAVSTDKQTITLKDADGKENVVHVNPLTKINSFPKEKTAPAAPAEADENAKKADRRPAPVPNTSLALADIKAGDWIAVRKFDTDTKVVEASTVAVAK